MTEMDGDEMCEYYAEAVLPGYNLMIGVCCKELIFKKYNSEIKNSGECVAWKSL